MCGPLALGARKVPVANILLWTAVGVLLPSQ